MFVVGTTGFCPGFYVSSDIAEFQYKFTEYYASQFEHSLLWDGLTVAIGWPVHGEVPILSVKDQQGKLFDDSPTLG